MGIRIETTPDGRIVRRRTDGPGAGELAGSVSVRGAAGIPAPPVAPVPLTLDAQADAVVRLLDEDPLADPDTAAAPVLDGDPRPGLSAEASTFLASLTPQMRAGYDLGRALPAGLGEEQAVDIYGALRRSVSRWPEQPTAPTQEQWQEWLDHARARISDPGADLPEEFRAASLARPDALDGSPAPDATTFAVLRSVESRTWRARYALDDHARYIAAWHDADEFEVRAVIAAAREEFYAARDAGTPVAAPDDYRKAWSRTAGQAPRDPATAYAFWAAEDPSRYAGDRPAARFVALDLETTGLSTRDAHIIEIGLVEYDATGRETGRWTQLIRPPVGEDGVLSTGDEKVMSVHGIRPEQVADAPSFADVVPALRERLTGATLIGHNLGFDTKHLRVALSRHDEAAGVKGAGAPWTGEADTLIHASRHLTGLPDNKLATVAGAHGIAYTHGHRAEHDAAVAGALFFRLREGLRAKAGPGRAA